MYTCLPIMIDAHTKSYPEKTRSTYATEKKHLITDSKPLTIAKIYTEKLAYTFHLAKTYL